MAKRQGGKSSPAGGGSRSRPAGSDTTNPEAKARDTKSGAPASGEDAKAAKKAEGAASSGGEGTKAAPAASGPARARPPTEGAPPKRGQRIALWSLVFLLVAGAVATVTWSVWPYIGPRIAALGGAGPELEPRVAHLENRMAALELSIRDMPDPEDLKLAEAATALVNEKADGLINRVGALETSLDEIEQSVAGLRAAVQQAPAEPVASEAKQAARRNAERLEELQARVAELEAAGARLAEGAARRRQALVIAVAQLGEALRGSGPFAAEVETLRALAEDDPEVAETLDTLSARAGRGIPTLPELQSRFPRVANAVVDAGAAAKDGDWIDDAVSRVSTLVKVRRTGAGVAGDTPEAVVARAEAFLQGGDLAGAVQELEALKGPAASAAADWITDARDRLEAERTLDSLRTHVIAQLADDQAESQVNGSRE